MVQPIAFDHILPIVQRLLRLSFIVLLAVIYATDPNLSMYHLASNIARFIRRVTFKIFWLLGLAFILIYNGIFFVIVALLIWVPGAVFGYILDELEEIWGWRYPPTSLLQSVASMNDVLWEIDRTTDISDLELSPGEAREAIDERKEIEVTLHNGWQLCPSDNISTLELADDDGGDEDKETLQDLHRAVLEMKEENEGEERDIEWEQRDAHKLTLGELKNKVEGWKRGIEEAGVMEL
ncbi:hypothetical protein B7494_g3832 [Chlorociboria aeruginascens]|nr:hypothetical protein B7494_g3832 [Chlorociboria aeruginascens]